MFFFMLNFRKKTWQLSSYYMVRVNIDVAPPQPDIGALWLGVFHKQRQGF